MKRRAVSNGNNKGGSSAGGNEMASCESPGVYLPTEAQRSPADDWSDWTSFTLELEVHPTTGADGSSLRYISLPPPIDTIRAGFIFPFVLSTHTPAYVPGSHFLAFCCNYKLYLIAAAAPADGTRDRIICARLYWDSCQVSHNRSTGTAKSR